VRSAEIYVCYALLKEEANILQQVMEHNDRDDIIIEGITERIKKSRTRIF